MSFAFRTGRTDGILVRGGNSGIGAQTIIIEPVTPTEIADPHVGFRVEGIMGDKAGGKVVVRVNGRWVEAELSEAI